MSGQKVVLSTKSPPGGAAIGRDGGKPSDKVRIAFLYLMIRMHSLLERARRGFFLALVGRPMMHEGPKGVKTGRSARDAPLTSVKVNANV